MVPDANVFEFALKVNVLIAVVSLQIPVVWFVSPESPVDLLSAYLLANVVLKVEPE